MRMIRLILALLVAASACATQAIAQVRELPTPAGAGSLGPDLHRAPDGRVFLSWIERLGEAGDSLRFSVLGEGGWTPPRTIAEGRDWFVNWADFPSLIALDDGSLAAHWLERSGPGTYAYDVRIAQSGDGGLTWSTPVTPHRDGTPTEHGFVSLFSRPGGGLDAVWLDGRETSPGAGEHDHGGGAMTLRYAAIGPDGSIGREALLDSRVCDCCQTGAALTAGGLLVVYRDRSAEEIRDIAAVRLRGRVWTEPQPVSADGWRIEGCPVNGPAVAARGRLAAVAWFTAAGQRPKVRVAFSTDSGARFAEALGIDDGDPAGQVDAVLLEDGSVVVSWVESTSAGPSLRVRRAWADGRRGPSVTVVPAGRPLGRGFPRMVLADERLVFAWTAEGVRTAVMPVPR